MDPRSEQTTSSPAIPVVRFATRVLDRDMNRQDFLIVVLLVASVALGLYLLHRHPAPHTPAYTNQP
jgi:hypothetical protein